MSSVTQSGSVYRSLKRCPAKRYSAPHLEALTSLSPARRAGVGPFNAQCSIPPYMAPQLQRVPPASHFDVSLSLSLSALAFPLVFDVAFSCSPLFS